MCSLKISLETDGEHIFITFPNFPAPMYELGIDH